MPVGAAVGAGAYIANRSVPSIRVIGDRDGMLIMLETDTERLLLLAGEVDKNLWSKRSNLITVGRERLDVIIATYANLLALSINGQTVNDSSTILSLQRNLSLPPLRGAVIPVADLMEIQVGEATQLTIRVIASIAGDEAPNFLITFISEGTTSVIASSSSAAHLASLSGVDALVVPGEIALEDIAGLRPSLLLSSMTERVGGSQDQILVFTDSTSELLLKNGAIHVEANQLLP
ncbi:MAG: hypothetical protein M9953_09780 [Thermomicrobiales bacterium]|nr:hypothetical protein [Thermomicrobiales bacterium]MCO5227514.1 hypothetical protein [Thermomicrobiales bacterium]